MSAQPWVADGLLARTSGITVLQQSRRFLDLGDEAIAGVASRSVQREEALVTRADDRPGLRTGEPSVLREQAFEFSLRRRALGEGTRLDVGDPCLRQQREGDDGDLPQ